jgi:hypothetical protein
VLKKYIVALVIALNILLCRFIDALIQTDTNVADLTRVANIIENVKTAKTMTQVCREIVHHNNLLDITSVVDIVVLLLSLDVNKSSFTLLVLRKTSSSKLTLKIKLDI